MSMADHVDYIMMTKKGFIRVTGNGFGRFGKKLTVDDTVIGVEVETIANGTLPRDMAVPVVVRAYDPETLKEVMEPIMFDSLKAFLGFHLAAEIRQTLEQQEIERI